MRALTIVIIIIIAAACRVDRLIDSQSTYRACAVRQVTAQSAQAESRDSLSTALTECIVEKYERGDSNVPILTERRIYRRVKNTAIQEVHIRSDTVSAADSITITARKKEVKEIQTEVGGDILWLLYVAGGVVVIVIIYKILKQ